MQLPTTKVWLAIKDAKQRDLAPFDPQMTHEVYEYYFRNYAVHFSAEAMSEAFATIPQVCFCFSSSFVISAEIEGFTSLKKACQRACMMS